MVSALASSSVAFPLSVSVKVLVNDWDLLRGTHKYRSSLVGGGKEERSELQRKPIMLNVSLLYYTTNAT